MTKLLIKQENIRINKNLDFIPNEFKMYEESKYVLFYYDKNVNRNRYEIKSVKRTDPRVLPKLDDESYRGHVSIEGYGELPLFVLDFTYPLYGVELTYQHITDKGTYYSVVKSPISFKLKNKEDRLCYDVVVYEYGDINDMLNNSWRHKQHIKAKKVEIPLDL